MWREPPATELPGFAGMGATLRYDKAPEVHRTSLGLDAECNDVEYRAGALGAQMGPFSPRDRRPTGIVHRGCKASDASSGGAARGHATRSAPPHPIAERGLSRPDEHRT